MYYFFHKFTFIFRGIYSVNGDVFPSGVTKSNGQLNCQVTDMCTYINHGIIGFDEFCHFKNFFFFINIKFETWQIVFCKITFFPK